MTRPAQTVPPTRGRLPVAARDRRPALAALALLLVLAGGLGAALVVYRTGQKTDVLVAAHTIRPGQRVSASDFTIARVSTDAGNLIASSRQGEFDGLYAITAIPGGTLLNPRMFQAADVIPPSGIVVGVSVGPAARPAGSITPGDVVRAYDTPKTTDTSSSGTGTGTSGPGTGGSVVLVDAALVVDVRASSNGDTEVVSLLVSPDAAAKLVQTNAQGEVALAALPVGTTPSVPYASTS
jgi:SAF domain